MDGILVLDKPRGISSMTAVAVVRRRAGGVKTGHAGTLDPRASGVLVLALGKATRSIDRLMATDKRYVTSIDLSAFTATDDDEAPREEVVVDQPPDERKIRSALEAFTGEVMQRPPAYSAMKIAGQRAYKLARAGKAPEMQARPVRVHSIRLLRLDWPLVELAIHCGKGFYVRSLARDLGVALGTGGHCVAIRRAAVGPFTIENATPLDDLADSIDQAALIPIDHALEMVDAAVNAQARQKDSGDR